MLKNILVLAVCLFTSISVYSQSFWFGPKGVVSFNIQNWDGFQRQPFLSFNGDVFIETEDEFSRSSFYAQLGIHTRGSSTRVNFFNGGAQNQSFRFNNLVFEAGAKQKLTSEPNSNYGATVGGGWEFEFSELIGGLIEFTINPDLSNQYEQQAIPNVIDPFTNQPITLRERRVRNLTFEVKFGLRFMRKVEYID